MAGVEERAGAVSAFRDPSRRSGVQRQSTNPSTGYGSCEGPGVQRATTGHAVESAVMEAAGKPIGLEPTISGETLAVLSTVPAWWSWRARRAGLTGPWRDWRRALPAPPVELGTPHAGLSRASGYDCRRRVKTGPSARGESGPRWAGSGWPRSLGSFAQSELGRAEVVGVEQWAEIRGLHFVGGLSQREICRQTGLHRDTIRRALNSEQPPVYRRAAKGSKLDAFKEEIAWLLREDPKLPGVRVRELLEPLGCEVSKTVVDDYLREVRPLFAPAPRTFQRTVYRPGEVCQFDVWQPRAEVPVGHRQTRKGWVVIACLGYSRAGAGVLVFLTQTEDLLAGIAGCLQRLGGLPKTLVWNRQAGIHGHGGRPSEASFWAS